MSGGLWVAHIGLDGMRVPSVQFIIQAKCASHIPHAMPRCAVLCCVVLLLASRLAVQASCRSSATPLMSA